MRTARVAVIGAGMAGLTSAIDLARAGMDVRVFERARAPGGKMREVTVDGFAMDAGPTVFTLRRVFDELYDDAGESLDRHVKLTPAKLLARHAWNPRGPGGGAPLDLFADRDRSVESIGAFAGPLEAQGFLRFTEHARRVFRTLEDSFIRAARPGPLGLVRRVGITGLGDLWGIQPFVSLWSSLHGYFKDPRLRQLFARYATYCGSSPFASPATLMLVAHVEQAGVWYVEGGMQRLAVALAALAEAKGAALRYGTEVAKIHTRRGRVCAVETSAGERVPVDAVVCNSDTQALAAGLFGRDVRRAVRPTPPAARSLSAITCNLRARTGGFDLAHHSVFFSADYRAEFDAIFRHRRAPVSPTIYVCAQDRHDTQNRAPRAERLLCLMNAPAIGDVHDFDQAERDLCEEQIFQTLAQFGLDIQRRPGATVVTTPTDFHRMFPGTGGALYGPASHGWMASFKRTGSRSAIPGLYLAGGSSHPGPGVPMAATSGRLAAECIKSDYASIAPYRTVAMSGGTSMP